MRLKRQSIHGRYRYLSEDDNVFTREFLLQLADHLLLDLLPWLQLGEGDKDDDGLATLASVELTGRLEVQLGEGSLKYNVRIELVITLMIKGMK